MSATVTPGIREFKPDNREHVQWLKKLDGLLVEMMSSRTQGVVGIRRIFCTTNGIFALKINPFGVTMPIEAFHRHSCRHEYHLLLPTFYRVMRGSHLQGLVKSFDFLTTRGLGDGECRYTTAVTCLTIHICM